MSNTRSRLSQRLALSRRAIIIAVGAVVIIASGIAMAAVVDPQHGAKSNRVSSGDKVTLHAVIYRADGVPLFATSPVEAERLANETGSASLLGTTRPPFGEVGMVVEARERVPGDLTRLFLDDLSGRASGETFTTVVQHAPYGDWTAGVTMPRVAGPFPLSPTVPRGVFERQFPGRAVGDMIHLSDPLAADAEIIAVSSEAVSYRNLLENGQRVVVQRIGLDASVLVDARNESFSLRFEPVNGQVFVVRGNCGPPLYDLPTGSYRVTDADEILITMEYNPSPYPPVVGEDLFARVTILDVEKASAWARFAQWVR